MVVSYFPPILLKVKFCLCASVLVLLSYRIPFIVWSEQSLTHIDVLLIFHVFVSW